MGAVTHLIMAPAEVETNSNEAPVDRLTTTNAFWGPTYTGCRHRLTMLPVGGYCISIHNACFIDAVYHVHLVYAPSYEKQNADILLH